MLVGQYPFGLLLFTITGVSLEGSTKTKQLTPSWEKPCPPECVCKLLASSSLNQRELKTVNCNNGNLEHIPLLLPKDTESLLLSGNKISIIKELPNLKHLQVLDLSNNIIKKIASHWLFLQFVHLRYLNIKNNSLYQLQHGTFSGLKQLDVLDLSNNKIHSIERDAFGGLNHLLNLQLDGNRLEEINPFWFEKVSLLTELGLSYNSLYKLHSRTFSILSKLSKLNISGNKISQIESHAFHGLSALCVLDFSNNNLNTIPTNEFQKLEHLEILILNFNLIKRVQANDFLSMNISELSLSYTDGLVTIEQDAFHNLPKLMILQLHDNKNLLYIHPSAFNNVPKLYYLYIHNNKLSALPFLIKKALPPEVQIHLYHNPLQCDCNIHWIKQEILHQGLANASQETFYDSDKLTCNYPPNRNNVLLKEIRLQKIPQHCSPTTLPLFSSSYNIPLGEDLSLECFGLGVPPPNIYWLLPVGLTINTSYPELRMFVTNYSILHLHQAHQTDSGTYTCIAQNSIGNDTSTTRVKVLPGRLNLIADFISDTFITIVLNGSEAFNRLSKYQIEYRETGRPDQPYKVIYLKHKMHRCTITRLKPNTMYELCIIYKTSSEQFRIHCIHITTKHVDESVSGITKIVDANTVIGAISAASIIITTCCIVAIIRKFRKRKEYEEPFGQDKLEPLSHIPLENLCHPPSTPLCSSRTSLISHSQA